MKLLIKKNYKISAKIYLYDSLCHMAYPFYDDLYKIISGKN